MLTVGSLFSGIGGFDLGFEQAGLESRWFCEIDAAATRVLQHHWPDRPVYRDVTELSGHAVEPVDIICGGFPCQDLSVAGKRAGLDGARSGLFHEFMRIVREMRGTTDGRYPAFVAIENVPGMLSSNGGRDFAVVLGTLAELGAMDIAWTVLDAQWFGVAQRRRRVFVIADFAGERAAEILALTDGLSGHPAPRREAREDVAGTLGGGTPNGGPKPDTDRMTFIPFDLTQATSEANRQRLAAGDPARTLHAAGGAHVITHTLSAEGADASEDETGRGTPVIAVRTANTSANGHGVSAGTAHALDGANGQAIAFAHDVAPAMTSNYGKQPDNSDTSTGPNLIAFSHTQGIDCQPSESAFPTQRREGGGQAVAFTASEQANSYAWESDVYPTLNAQSPSDTSNMQYGVRQEMAVRRLTPTECERLQGFPDDWTLVPDHRASADHWTVIDPPAGHVRYMADSARYRMLGNAVCVNVARYLGERILACG